MVDETNRNEKTASREQENARNGLASAPGGQHALALAPGDPALEAPDAHDGRRSRQRGDRRSRWDTRRTAEYLAERGRMPAESLHLITRKGLAEAVAYIRKAVPGASHEWAANYYLKSIELLLPFAHAPVKDLNMPSMPLDAIGGVAAHFLAASAASARLAAGAGAGVSPLSLPMQGMDRQSRILQLDVSEPATGYATDQDEGVKVARAGMPPKGRD